MIKPMNPLEKYRKERGIRRKTMAENLECTTANITHYERDDANPQATTIWKIKTATKGEIDLKVWMLYAENFRLYREEKLKEMEN